MPFLMSLFGPGTRLTRVRNFLRTSATLTRLSKILHTAQGFAHPMRNFLRTSAILTQLRKILRSAQGCAQPLRNFLRTPVILTPLRKNLRSAPVWTAAALLLSPTLPAAMPVEVTHPVADFLRRLEEKGVVTPGFWSTLPRDEAEVARVLAEAAAADRAATGVRGALLRFGRRVTGTDARQVPSGVPLSAWDRRRLERFRDEFDPARKRRSRLHYEDGSPFVVHGTVQFYTGVFLRDSLPGPDHHGFGHYGATAQATYSDFAWVTASAYAGSERHINDRRFAAAYQFNPAMGMTYSINRDGVNGSDLSVSTFDAGRVMLGVGTSGSQAHLRLEIGQDWNQWGPGRWQQSTLGARPHFWIADAPAARPATGYAGTPYPGSQRRGYRVPGEGPPLPQIRLRFGSSHWEYTKIIASRQGLWADSLATLFAHRLQVRLGPVRLGATEMTAVGTRTPEAVYFLPAMPLRVAEHEASDRDNAMMSFDAEWLLRGPLSGRLYGELLIDDFSGPPLDFWGNKLAYVLGGSWQDPWNPWGLPAELQGEFAHVDPWVYGHHRRNTQMQSTGSLLGSGLPPNSRSWRGALRFPLPGGLEGELNGLVRQRDLTSPGSSLFDGNPGRVGGGLHKEFLARDVETRLQMEAGVTWPWGRYGALRGGVGWLAVENFRGEPGEDLATTTGRVEVLLRY